MSDNVEPASLHSSSPDAHVLLDVSFPLPLSVPHVVAGVRSDSLSPADAYSADRAAARLALGRLFQASAFPAAGFAKMFWRRDALGKPFVQWSGGLAAWAETAGYDNEHLHVSNTHDGGAHVVAAAYSPDLVGLGVDLVWLPRLRRPGKGREYLLRFARRFMSLDEQTGFLRLADEPDLPTTDADERLRMRTAAHFSLMEAASKACGTGLKIGVGMGRETSLPKQSLGVRRLEPEIELLFEGEAQRRLDALGVVRYEAFVRADAEFLVSLVALYRSPRPELQKEAGGTQTYA